MSKPILAVGLEADADRRAIIKDALGNAGDAVYLMDMEDAERRAMMTTADAVFIGHTRQLPEDGIGLSGETCKLLQFYSAGVDFLPLKQFPEDLPIAGNGGAFAEPMAEHGLAMTLAAAKRLFIEHDNLKTGEFNQFARNKMLAGSVCGILGFGGIGKAQAKLMRGLGMKIHAINRSGATDEDVDWIGTPDQLEEFLAASDVVVLSLPLSQSTEKLFNAERLSQMKPDAILVNLARGEIIDEDDLYAHLQANPDFTACVDAWWVEPVRHGKFEMGQPFLDLPNVIGSPHNSASVGIWRAVAVRRAIANIVLAITGEAPQHLVRPEERMF